MSHRVVAIITDPIGGEEAVRQLKDGAGEEEIELRLIAPAIEANPLEHTLGDIDGPRRLARERVDASVASLRDAGLDARGEVGDPDPVQAATDALLESPADEVVIFEREVGESRWYEGDLTERAEEEIEPPLRIVTLEAAGATRPRPRVTCSRSRRRRREPSSTPSTTSARPICRASRAATSPAW